MEEIDIIELLKRVKEGNAPKEIEIEDEIFYLDEEEERGNQNIDLLYSYKNNMGCGYWTDMNLYINTKIKILDKPIIERLEVVDLTNIENTIINIGQKLNEIIDFINQNNKE